MHLHRLKKKKDILRGKRKIVSAQSNEVEDDWQMAFLSMQLRTARDFKLESRKNLEEKRMAVMRNLINRNRPRLSLDEDRRKKFQGDKQDDLSHGSGKNPVQAVFPRLGHVPDTSCVMTYDFNGVTIYNSASLRQRYTLNPDLAPKVQAYIVPISNRYTQPPR